MNIKITKAICDSSARRLRGLMESRELSPVELLESCIQRIEAVNPQVNAIVATCYDRARNEAQIAEQQFKNKHNLAPLTGLPVGIKDLANTQGLRTTFGSTLYANNIPDFDDRCVQQLRAAGAIIVGKTNTPEFGTGSETNNKVYGPTRNPHALEYSTGGSSGGSAAALATGMLPLCHGTDTGGSLRNPAAWCGVVGFRPTPGLVSSTSRNLNYSNFSVHGPMARNVRDTALMMSGLVGYDNHDPMSNIGPRDDFQSLDDIDLLSLRVACSEDLGIAPMDDGIRATFRAFAKRVEPEFHCFEHCDPELSNARDIFWVLRCVSFLANHQQRYQEHASVLSEHIIANIEQGLSMGLADVAKAERQWAQLYRDFETYFENFDLLITPTNMIPPFLHSEGIAKSINGVVMENYMDASLIRSALTLTGHPIISIPCGVDPSGLPFGIQVVGPRHGDHFLLSAAAALETVINTLTHAPTEDLTH